MINKQKIALYFFSHTCLDYSISFNNTFRTVMCEGWHFSRMWKTLAYDNCTSSLREEFRVHMRGGFIRYIGPWPGEPIMDTWISEGPHSLSHKRFIFIFPFFGGVFLTQTLNIGSKAVLFRLGKFLLEALVWWEIQKSWILKIIFSTGCHSYHIFKHLIMGYKRIFKWQN